MDIESGNFKIESLEALLFFNKLFFFSWAELMYFMYLIYVIALDSTKFWLMCMFF